MSRLHAPSAQGGARLAPSLVEQQDTGTFWGETPVLLGNTFPQVRGNPDHHVIMAVRRHFALDDDGLWMALAGCQVDKRPPGYGLRSRWNIGYVPIKRKRSRLILATNIRLTMFLRTTAVGYCSIDGVKSMEG